FAAAGAPDLGDLSRETVYVLGLLHQEGLRNQARKVGVHMAGGFDALVEPTLDGFPERVAGRLKNNAAAHNFGVVGEIGVANDIEIPLRVILRAWSNAFLGHETCF